MAVQTKTPHVCAHMEGSGGGIGGGGWKGGRNLLSWREINGGDVAQYARECQRVQPLQHTVLHQWVLHNRRLLNARQIWLFEEERVILWPIDVDSALDQSIPRDVDDLLVTGIVDGLPLVEQVGPLLAGLG